jgi:heme exporter protein A
VAIDTVSVSKLSKRYGFHRALASVSLQLASGELCALLGPNGAGKSTLLGILSTLIRPSGGKVDFCEGDKVVAAGPALRSRIGVLAHSSFLYGGLTGIENLLFWAKLYEVDNAPARAAALLDEVGLDEEARVRPAQTYSRGMQQRLALARVLMHDPQVLLLDEPFTGLDRAGAAALARTLARARAEGRIVLVVTHDLEAIDGIADRVVVLRRGKLVHHETSNTGYPYRELKDVYHRFTE